MPDIRPIKINRFGMRVADKSVITAPNKRMSRTTIRIPPDVYIVVVLEHFAEISA